MSFHDLVQSLLASEPGQLLGPMPAGANFSSQQLTPGSAPPPAFNPTIPTGGISQVGGFDGSFGGGFTTDPSGPQLSPTGGSFDSGFGGGFTTQPKPNPVSIEGGFTPPPPQQLELVGGLGGGFDFAPGFGDNPGLPQPQPIGGTPPILQPQAPALNPVPIEGGLTLPPPQELSRFNIPKFGDPNFDQFTAGVLPFDPSAPTFDSRTGATGNIAPGAITTTEGGRVNAIPGDFSTGRQPPQIIPDIRTTAPAQLGTPLNPEVLPPATPVPPAPLPILDPTTVSPPSTGLPPGPTVSGGDPFFPQTNRPGVGEDSIQTGDEGAFQLDPRDSEKAAASMAQFVNILLNSLAPGITSGSFTNPNQISDVLQLLFNNTGLDPGSFQNFQNQLAGFASGTPFGDLLNTQLTSQLQGEGGQFAGELGQASDIFSAIGAGGAPGGGDVLSRMQQLLNDPTQILGESGRSEIGGVASQELINQIQSGGLSENFINAARERILGPANEALQGRLNRQGGGVASINSPLFQELQRRQDADFSNDLILQSLGAQQTALGQGLQSAGLEQNRQFSAIDRILQQFAQGGQFQNQLTSQQFGGAQGLQGLSQGQSQLNQQATQLGLGRESLQADQQNTRTQQALQFLQLMNQFGLGQTDITARLLQTILSGVEQGGTGDTLIGTILGSVTDVATAGFSGGGGTQ